MPTISVVMPAYNAAATLAAALESLARQSYRDFEVVLVDDASTDATPRIAEGFRDLLPLRVLRNDRNSGVARSLNHGIAAGDSQYVARLDADDLAEPGRLARQHEFFAAHGDVDVLGTHMVMFRDEDPAPMGALAHPVADAGIKTALIQRCTLSHPSVMLRRSFFGSVGTYDAALDYAEDYDLWCRGALLGKRYANLPELLTRYRVHGGQVGRQHAQKQYDRDILVKRRYIGALLGDTPPGYLPEIFSAATRFATRELAATAFTESCAALIALGARVRDAAEYAAIVKSSMRRHLVEAAA